MLRVLLEPALFFLAPFAIYILALWLRRIAPFAVERWTQSVVATLILAGLATAVLSVFVFGIFADRSTGGYVPAHIENGRIVPGQLH